MGNDRTCIVCRQKDDPANMSRFSLIEGEIIEEATKGRGAWVHPDCLNDPKLDGKLRYHLKGNKSS